MPTYRFSIDIESLDAAPTQRSTISVDIAAPTAERALARVKVNIDKAFGLTAPSVAWPRTTLVRPPRAGRGEDMGPASAKPITSLVLTAHGRAALLDDPMRFSTLEAVVLALCAEPKSPTELLGCAREERHAPHLDPVLVTSKMMKFLDEGLLQATRG